MLVPLGTVVSVGSSSNTLDRLISGINVNALKEYVPRLDIGRLKRLKESLFGQRRNIEMKNENNKNNKSIKTGSETGRIIGGSDAENEELKELITTPGTLGYIIFVYVGSVSWKKNT